MSTEPNSSTEHILVETRGRVGLITLNRPKALNALNHALMLEVVEAARGFDRAEAWFRRRHPAVQLTLGGLTTALTMAVIAGSWWLLAPAGWPLTRG